MPPALELDAARDEVLGLQHRLDEGELALVELDPLAVGQNQLEVGLGLVEKVAQVCVAREVHRQPRRAGGFHLLEAGQLFGACGVECEVGLQPVFDAEFPVGDVGDRGVDAVVLAHLDVGVVPLPGG